MYRPARSSRCSLALWTAAALLCVTVSASPGADEILKIKERAKFLADFRAMLEHSDSSIRTAAVEQGLGSKDAELRSMALDAALGSKDAELQTTGLRWLIRNRQRLPITVELPDDASKAQQLVFQRWHGFVLAEPRLAEGSDEILLKNGGYDGGSIVRGGLTLTFRSPLACVVDAKVATPTLLTGSLQCTFSSGDIRRVGATGATVPIRIKL